jgi:hypothetical protein
VLKTDGLNLCDFNPNLQPELHAVALALFQIQVALSGMHNLAQDSQSLQVSVCPQEMNSKS